MESTDLVDLSATEDLSRQEALVLAALKSAPGRVLGRNELARIAGVAPGHRRVDVLLVSIRRQMHDGEIINVRNRGWRFIPSQATS